MQPSEVYATLTPTTVADPRPSWAITWGAVTLSTVGQSVSRATAVGAASSVTLGAVAGYVDAICFGHLFGVFPANQSGNAIFLGVAIGDGSTSQAWRPAAAMIGFALGVAGAVALGAATRAQLRARLLLLIEIVMLAAVAVDVGSVTDVSHLLDGARGGGLLIVASAAMGVQTEIIRSHAGVTLATTYQTGALTHIAEDVADAATGGRERKAGSARAIVILSTVLVGYIAGAALGARLGSTWGAALAVPVVALVALLAAASEWTRVLD